MDDEQRKRGYLSIEDMKWWLEQETRDVDKARELRLREATEIVSAYAQGKLTPEEMSKRLLNYEDRWGDALPGAHAHPDMTDEQIIGRIDAANSGERKWLQEYKRERTPNRPGAASRQTER